MAGSAARDAAASSGGLKGYATATVNVAEGGERLLALWREGFNEMHRPEAKLDWYYRRNPEGPPLVSFLVHGDRREPVGTASAGRRRFRFGSEMLAIRIPVDFVVLSRHRTLFPALLLQREIKRRAGEDCEILVGTPNRMSQAVFGRLQYKRLGALLRRARVLRSAPYLSRLVPAWLGNLLGPVIDRLRLAVPALRRLARAGYRGEWIEEPDSRFDDLWQRIAAPGVLMGVRDRAFLAWRFVDCPLGRARFFTLGSRDGRRLFAYAACETRGQALYVRDFLVDPAAPGAFSRLWAELTLEAFRQGHASLSVTLLGDGRLHRSLNAAGLRARDEQPVYAAATGRWAALMDERHWYLTPADEDG